MPEITPRPIRRQGSQGVRPIQRERAEVALRPQLRRLEERVILSELVPGVQRHRSDALHERAEPDDCNTRREGMVRGNCQFCKFCTVRSEWGSTLGPHKVANGDERI